MKGKAGPAVSYRLALELAALFGALGIGHGDPTLAFAGIVALAVVLSGLAGAGALAVSLTL